MFPHNNNPFQQNLLGPPYGQPPVFPPRMAPPRMSNPLGIVPPGLPQNMSAAPSSILPGQPSVFQNTRALSSSSQSYHPTGMSNQRFPTHNQSQGSYTGNAPTSTVPGQGKDNVTKMTVDFIKQFQEQVAKRKVTEEKNNRMKVQSKASVQRQTLRDDRDGSPFSDVSDSDLAGGTNKPAEPAPLKGILRNKAPQQPVSSSTSLNPGQSTMSSRSTGISSNQYSTQTSTASKPQASTGLSSILKNYEESRRSSSSQRGSRSETTQSSEQTGKSIPTLTRSDSNRDRSRSAQRYDSGKGGALQDVSDNDGNSDEIHVQSQVFVGNLPNVTEDDMLSYFSKYRIEVWIGRHRRDKTKACAFVKTETMKEARELIAEFKHGRFKGNNLHVRYTAASDFENYKVATLADMRRDISPEPTRDSKYDSSRERQYGSTADQQQVYYTPVQQVPQYLPNTGDGYSMPVYLVPPSMPQTQQVFIPAGAYPVDFQGPQSHYDTPDYGSQISDTHSRHSRDYSPVPERRKYMVYVGNLPINLSLASLEAYLTKQNHCGINLKSKDGQAYAFVDFYDYEDARNMVRELDNKKCYGRNIHVRMGDEDEPINLDGKNKRDRDRDRDRDRSRDRDGESEKERKSLFKGYVEAAFANAPLLGKKYITEYLSTKETRAVYVCSVCMEMSYGSEVAEHIVGYRHRLKCFRKDEPNIYDKMCRIREKSKMMMECARMAADYEILREKIMIQMCIDPEERAKKHLDNIKDASFIGSRKSKDKESSPAKESRSSSSSSSMDIFKRIAMHKKKLEETKKDDKKKDTRTSSDTQSSKSKSLADKIVGQIASRQKEEDNVKVDTKTKEMERKKEEEKQWKIMEAKQKEADMKKRLEEARQKVIENQKKLEEDRKKKAEEERKRKEDERRAEEDRKRKLEEKRIEEEKRKLAEQKRKLEQERRELEQQKLQEAKKRALEDVKKKEEDMRKQQEEEKLRKEQEEQQKVELMLQMLEQQKREEEEARKLEEEKHRQLQEEQRQAELKRQEEIAKAERLKLEEQRRKLEKFEREKNEAEAIKKRNLQLHVLKEMEEKRRKDMQAEQKRQAALKRVEEIKKADTGTGGAKVIPEFPLIYDQKYFDQYENELSFEQKLVQAKRKGYMTLPFSMEEKRMFLKSNLGPYDKIGPDPNSKIDSVLALKYNMKGADFPLIGLQYIVEGFEGKEMSNSSHRYFCELCCIESSNCDGVIQHIIGFVHRKKYLEIHKADEYAQLMQQDLRRGTLNELTKQKAINIEHESGRHQIPTLAMFEFRALVIKMKEVEMAYKNQSQKPDPKLAPKNHDEIVKVKKMIEMSEKDDITQTDQSVYDPTLNVQANLNRMVAAACVVKLEEGWTWVEFYKYLDQRKITNEPLLGLQYITEVRGNKRYAPKYTCNLCDMTTLNSPDKVIEHLNSKDHLIKVLNFMHPEKIVGNPLLERKLTDIQRTEVLRNIARSATAGRKERESLKVGVLLVENVWRTWHEQSREDKAPTMSQEDIEFEEELQQEGDNLRPQLYDLLRSVYLPICGLEYILEVQSDVAPTHYFCKLCRTMKIPKNSIVGHLRSRDHRKKFIRKVKPPNWGTIIRTDLDEYLKRRPNKGESITVKKTLYMNAQGVTTFTEPVVMPDPKLGNTFMHMKQKPVQMQKAEDKAAAKEANLQAKSGIIQINPTPTQAATVTNQSAQAKPAGDMNQGNVPGQAAASKQVATSQKPGTSQNVQSKQSISEPVKKDQSGQSTQGTRPTRFDKIIKGLDYTPLLGIEFMTEVQDEKGIHDPRFECALCNQMGDKSSLTCIEFMTEVQDEKGIHEPRFECTLCNQIGDKSYLTCIEFMTEVQDEKGIHDPRFECVLCNQMGDKSSLTCKNILRHVWTKGHRMSYIQKNHPEAYKQIKLRTFEKTMAKLDRYTKEIGAKHRGQIKVRVEKNPNFWKESFIQEKADDDDEVKIVIWETPSWKAPPPPKPKPAPVSTLETVPAGPLDLDKIANETDGKPEAWKVENEKIKEGIETGLFVASSRCSKFLADYNATFCTYPIIGLQWITEFHSDKATEWWCVCRLCEEKIHSVRKLSDHMSGLTHRLRYLQKKYPPIYTNLKRENLNSMNMLKQKVYKQAQDVMKKEAKEFKPEVMFVKTVEKVKTVVSSGVRSIPTVGSGGRQTPAAKHTCSTSNIKVLTPEDPVTAPKHPLDTSKPAPIQTMDSKTTAPVADKLENTKKSTSSDRKPVLTPVKRSNSSPKASDTPSKRLKTDKDDSKQRADTNKDKDTSKSKEASKDKKGDKAKATEDADCQIVEKKEDIEVIDLEISSDAVRETLKRKEEKPELKNLKKSVKEDADMETKQTKTPDLKRGLEDSDDDDDVKIKRSKADHKARSYRDSYGTSYGVDRDRKSDSRTRSPRSGDSRRRRSRSRSRSRQGSRRGSSRDRGRSDRDKDRKSSRDDRDKSRSDKSSPRKKEETKPKEDKENKVEEEEENLEGDYSGSEGDFDSFIMAQLGEDFVTVDELEGGEEDSLTVDDTNDNNNTARLASSEGDIEMGENVQQERGADKQDKTGNVPEQSDSDKANDKSENVSSEETHKEENTNSQKDKNDKPSQEKDHKTNEDAISTINIRGRRRHAYKTVDKELEVSVEIGEEKSPEKSDFPTEMVAEIPPSSHGLSMTSLHVQIEAEPTSSDDVNVTESAANKKPVDKTQKSDTQTSSDEQKPDSKDTPRDSAPDTRFEKERSHLEATLRKLRQEQELKRLRQEIEVAESELGVEKVARSEDEPALVKEIRVHILTDSIAANVDDLRCTRVIPFPDVNIARLTDYVEKNPELVKSEFVMLHVGTNDVNPLTVQELVGSYLNLLALIKKINPTAKIIISSILPRPIDHDSTGSKLKSVNEKVCKYCEQMNVKYVRSYRRFFKFGKPRRELFSVEDGGLNLSPDGTRQLRLCFIQVISHLFKDLSGDRSCSSLVRPEKEPEGLEPVSGNSTSGDTASVTDTRFEEEKACLEATLRKLRQEIEAAESDLGVEKVARSEDKPSPDKGTRMQGRQPANKNVSRQPRRGNKNTASIVVEINSGTEPDSKLGEDEPTSSGVTVEIDGADKDDVQNANDKKNAGGKKVAGKKTGAKTGAKSKGKQVANKSESVEKAEDNSSNKSDTESKTVNDGVEKSSKTTEEETDKQESEAVSSDQSTNVAASPTPGKGKTPAKSPAKTKQAKSPAASKKAMASTPTRQTRSTRQSNVTSITMEIDEPQKSPVKSTSKDNKSSRKKKNEVEVSIEIG